MPKKPITSDDVIKTAAEASDVYWGRVGGRVLVELERRLNDKAESAKLPGTLLMRLVEKYIEYLERQEEKADDEEVGWLTPLQAIDQEGLPYEKKLEILTYYMETLEADHKLAEEKLAELVKEGNNGSTPVHEPAASR